MDTAKMTRRDLFALLRKRFDVSRYEATRDLTLVQWVNEINARLLASRYLEAGGDVEEFLDITLTNPLVTHRLGTYLRLTSGSAIHELTPRDFLSFHHEITDERLSDVREACRKDLIPRRGAKDEERPSKTERVLLSTSMDDLLEERTGAVNWIPRIMVSMTASDEQILGDFRKWLESTRQRKREFPSGFHYEPRSKNVRPRDISDWNEYRVLAYADLCLIEDCVGAKLTLTQKANLLFPDEYDRSREELVRKTCAKHYQKIFSQHFVAALWAQAQGEHAE